MTLSWCNHYTILKPAWILECSCFTGRPRWVLWCAICKDHNEFVCSWSTSSQIIWTNASKGLVCTCSTSFEWLALEFGSNILGIWAIRAIDFSGFEIKVIWCHQRSLEVILKCSWRAWREKVIKQHLTWWITCREFSSGHVMTTLLWPLWSDCVLNPYFWN